MVFNMVATLLWIVLRASNEAEVGPSARTQEGALLERWLVQCGVRAPLYSIALNGREAPAHHRTRPDTDPPRSSYVYRGVFTWLIDPVPAHSCSPFV
jgi:hypothetical protein